MKISHLGIAVHNIEESLGFWGEGLGLESLHTEVVADQKVRVAMLPVGETRIELLEPTEEDSPVGKFLSKRGGGIHHVAVEVEDIEEALEQLKASGARLIDEVPKTGAGGCLIAFVHPKSTGGVLIELVQETDQSRSMHE